MKIIKRIIGLLYAILFLIIFFAPIVILGFDKVDKWFEKINEKFFDFIEE